MDLELSLVNSGMVVDGHFINVGRTVAVWYLDLGLIFVSVELVYIDSAYILAWIALHLWINLRRK